MCSCPTGYSGALSPPPRLLFSNGELELSWPEAPYEATEATITANYNAADTYFELLQQGSGGSNTVVGTYTIDPVDNDSGRLGAIGAAGQSRRAADRGQRHIWLRGGGQPQTAYTLAEGQAVPQTVSFSLYSGNREAPFSVPARSTRAEPAFVPNGKPSIVPTGGYLGTYNGNASGLYRPHLVAGLCLDLYRGHVCDDRQSGDRFSVAEQPIVVELALAIHGRAGG